MSRDGALSSLMESVPRGVGEVFVVSTLRSKIYSRNCSCRERNINMKLFMSGKGYRWFDHTPNPSSFWCCTECYNLQDIPPLVCYTYDVCRFGRRSYMFPTVVHLSPTGFLVFYGIRSSFTLVLGLEYISVFPPLNRPSLYLFPFVS